MAKFVTTRTGVNADGSTTHTILCSEPFSVCLCGPADYSKVFHAEQVPAEMMESMSNIEDTPRYYINIDGLETGQYMIIRKGGLSIRMECRAIV